MGLPLLALLAAWSVARPPAPDNPQQAKVAETSADEQVFRDAGLDPSATGVVQFFRDRTGSPQPDQITALIRQLGGSDGVSALAALIRIGYPAVAQLRPVANGLEDLVAAQRARRCLELIEGRNGERLARSGAHLIATLHPGDSPALLLAYLPYAESEAVRRDLEDALLSVTPANGRPDATLLAALGDAVPLRRAAAAAAVCRSGGTDSVVAVRPLLKDAVPLVRQKAALGLAAHNVAEAVPVLIDLLAEGSIDRREIEDYLSRLAGEWAVAAPKGADRVAVQLRRETWAAWWRSVDGPALLAEFRSRTLSDAELERARSLLTQLGSDSVEVSDAALTALDEMGDRVAPLLRRAANGRGRIAEQARVGLQEIARNQLRPLPSAAGRLLALRRPAGSLEALLAYLPCADSDDAEASLAALLPDLGIRDKIPEPALLAALNDRLSLRRAAAAEAICAGKAINHLSAVRTLLNDRDADVRRRAALALVDVHDEAAIPALIDLLAVHPSVQRATEVEEMLCRIAGEHAPELALNADADVRAKVRSAWLSWWQEHRADMPLADFELRPRQLNHILAVDLWHAGKAEGRVVELDENGKICWQIGKLMGPQEARFLPGGHLLIAEQNANRVTERDLTGKVIWEYPVPMAFQCQRLANGHTFMAGRNILLELDRSGKEVFSLRRQQYLLAARRFRNGQIGIVTTQGEYVRLDQTGKELMRFRLPLPGASTLSSAEVLSGDHVLVCANNQNRVAEYDADGKTVWEASILRPGNPTRLANGHTMVVTANSRGLTEFDRSGVVVNEWKEMAVAPWRVDRR
jgi:HEAT repeat protein